MARGGKGRKNKNKKEGVDEATEGVQKLTTEDGAGTSQPSVAPVASAPLAAPPAAPQAAPPAAPPAALQAAPPAAQRAATQPPTSQLPMQQKQTPAPAWGKGRGRDMGRGPGVPQPGQQHVGQLAPQQLEQSVPQHVGQPMPQHMGQPMLQQIGQPMPQHVGQPMPQHMGQPMLQQIGQPMPQHVGQPMPQHMGQPMPQHMGQPIPQHMGQLTPQHMGQPISRAPSPQKVQAAQSPRQLAQTPRASPSRAQTPAKSAQNPTSAPSQQAAHSQQASPRQQQASGDRQQQVAKLNVALPQEQKYADMVIPKKTGSNNPSLQGRSVQVLVNYLELGIGCKKVYRYDIIFTPEKPKKFLPKVLNIFHQQFFPNYFLAFDQMKNFVSSKPLKGVNMHDRFVKKVSIMDSMNKKMEFEVAIKQTGEIEMSPLFEYMKNGTSMNPPQEAIQCLDIILKPQNPNFIKAGRSYFTKPVGKAYDLGKGMEMWPGIFQSAIFASRPFINIDAAHKGFPRAQSVLDMFLEFRADLSSPLDNQFRGSLREEIDKYLRGLKVLVPVAGAQNNLREMKCSGLDKPANQIVFTLDDGKGHKQQMNVANYFATKGIRLRYPHLNCLWFGTKEKRIHYPPEICTIPSEQVLNRKLSEDQISKMVREAATDPNVRRAKIKGGITAMDYKNSKLLKDFQLTVGDEFVKVNARVLKPPKLQYTGGVQEPRDGVWRTGKFFTPITVDRWVVLVVEMDQHSANVEALISSFLRKSAQVGMTMAKPLRVMDNVKSHLLQAPMSECRDRKVQLIVVVMPWRNPAAYNKIKNVAEKQVGILTQCVKEQTMKRMSDQTAENLLLKINTKLAGVNQVLHQDTMPICLKKAKCMIVGADVTHPSPDQTNVPSIAAVTASMDEKCFAYNVTLSVQSPRREMIDDMENMMREHLQSYYTKMKDYPTKIIYFRDGVSEGQFSQVLQFELTAMQAACISVKPDYKPEIVFLTVQKRHHTRFFMLNNDDKRNVEPGTIVDTTITHPTELDYYLVSHKAIKGTARPTRYHCIANQWKVPDDVLQQLTYHLCHLYSRCSRAVSYPAPTYYAHLACSRARVLTFGETFDNLALERAPKRLRVLENMITDNPMFFV